MFNIGGLEFLIILVVALIFLGPERLPGAARQAGKTLGALREMAQSFQDELQDAMNDPIESDARAKGAAAVGKGAPAAVPPASVDTAPATDATASADKDDDSAADGASAGSAGPASTAAYIAGAEPDRSHKPQSGSVNGAGAHNGTESADTQDDEAAQQVPDPGDLEFGSAAPRYPRAEPDADDAVLDADDAVFDADGAVFDADDGADLVADTAEHASGDKASMPTRTSGDEDADDALVEEVLGD